ncbi:hypothetical protein POSPLADRAFT_1049305 [Postia placenta MAD-698-R-SB12]|uniref:DUF6534 domain-containing protein n=1 Tax=Postia placenta MAD-698-R-SB12 TaxID=670580 RepID=A0A1X6MQJ8_9APHY|nr:hypothetical protein POSPLADRAFT_1049305 [Postia placenta MAD-698-R-SB12]OSX58472.1 hypothetical protein POSPLADRAFT_1049305 [Postia placenta MAD-698-R-SB12]
MSTEPELDVIDFILEFSSIGASRVSSVFKFQDRLAMRLLVYALLIFEWVQTGLVTDIGMEAFVYHYGNLEALVNGYNAWFSTAVMSGIVAGAVQHFFAWPGAFAAGNKLKKATSNTVTDSPSLIVNLLTVKCFCVLINTQIWLAGSAAVDIIIACAMIIILLRMKAGTANSDALVNRIIRLIVETAAVAVVDLALCIGYPGKAFFSTPYANTLLTNLLDRFYTERPETQVHTFGTISLALNTRPSAAATTSGLTSPRTDLEDQVSVEQPKCFILEELDGEDVNHV